MDFGQNNFSPEEEVEMARLEKQHINMGSRAMKASPATEFNRIGALYDELNTRGRRNMERLADLITRLEGPSPEKVNAGGTPNRPTPQGLIHAFMELNETNSHQTEIIELMISKLEELL